MAYEVHITRRVDWMDEEGPVIALDEWLAIAAADADLRHDATSEVTAPDGSVLSFDTTGRVVWTAHPEGREVTFLHVEDRISASYPDEATIAKMVALAVLLGARVQGDEGECYGEPEVPSPPTPDADPPKKRRWFSR